jgi:hypothetical protein
MFKPQPGFNALGSAAYNSPFGNISDVGNALPTLPAPPSSAHIEEEDMSSGQMVPTNQADYQAFLAWQQQQRQWSVFIFYFFLQ